MNPPFHQLSLPELIRMNQLVRDEIDLAGFGQWYESSTLPVRLGIIYSLADFAFQAGVDEDILENAVQTGKLDKAAPVVRDLFNFSSPSPDWSALHQWLQTAADAELVIAFRFYTCLFGCAEQRVYQSQCDKDCTHWWHRDLKDPRVVRDLLRNPRYFLTSRNDDASVRRWDWLVRLFVK